MKSRQRHGRERNDQGSLERRSRRRDDASRRLSQPNEGRDGSDDRDHSRRLSKEATSHGATSRGSVAEGGLR